MNGFPYNIKCPSETSWQHVKQLLGVAEELVLNLPTPLSSKYKLIKEQIARKCEFDDARKCDGRPSYQSVEGGEALAALAVSARLVADLNLEINQLYDFVFSRSHLGSHPPSPAQSPVTKADAKPDDSATNIASQIQQGRLMLGRVRQIVEHRLSLAESNDSSTELRYSRLTTAVQEVEQRCAQITAEHAQQVSRLNEEIRNLAAERQSLNQELSSLRDQHTSVCIDRDSLSAALQKSRQEQMEANDRLQIAHEQSLKAREDAVVQREQQRSAREKEELEQQHRLTLSQWQQKARDEVSQVQEKVRGRYKEKCAQQRTTVEGLEKKLRTLEEENLALREQVEQLKGTQRVEHERFVSVQQELASYQQIASKISQEFDASRTVLQRHLGSKLSRSPKRP